MEKDTLERYRAFLKDTLRLTFDFSQTDQSRGVPAPPLEKPFDPQARRVRLPAPDEWTGIAPTDLCAAIAGRQSHRRFRREPLSLEELAFLLWATQGVRRQKNPARVYRTVPSAGCRHAFETYLAVLNVSGLEPGIYRYLPVEHELLFEFVEEKLGDKVAVAALGQTFVGRGAVTFIWTAIPYRMEWRYGLAAHKVIALDAGHVCQNLYLACAAVGAGTCAIAAYHQAAMDELLRLDGQEEFVIYLAPVGKV
jgi:SagB-type dehydrogenase family enzyme